MPMGTMFLAARGTQDRKRKHVPKKKTKITKKTVAKVAKNVVMNLSETKMGNYALENQQLYHNDWAYPDTNACYTSQGTTDSDNSQVENRVGNAIQPRKLWWRIQLFNKLDRPNLHYRICVFRRNTDSSGGLTTVPSGEPEQVFFPAVLGNLMILPWNREQCTPVFDRIYTVTNPNYGASSFSGSPGNKEISKIVDINIDLKKYKQFTYNQGGGVPKNAVYQLGILAYDAYGTLTTDNVASYAMLRRFYFKDV